MNPERRRYDRIAPLFDLMETVPERMSMSFWRKQLFAHLPSGKILELGVGTGKNFRYYPKERTFFGADISFKMLQRAARKRNFNDVEIFLTQANAEMLSFKSETFDAVITTFVFCSVSNPIRGLEELKRVLKKGGRALFLEHVRPQSSPLLGKIFDLLNPVVVRMMGANINRNTVKNIEKAGFVIDSVTDLWQDIVKLIIAHKS